MFRFIKYLFIKTPTQQLEAARQRKADLLILAEAYKVNRYNAYLIKTME